jgi:methylmalonyl-CoA mutase N-terminal domain/subunit
MKKERDGNKVKEALTNLKAVLEEGEENVVPSTLAAATAYATVAEIIGVYKEVYGEYQLATEGAWVA